MADLGNTHSASLTQSRRTPAETYSSSVQDRGTYADHPSSSSIETELGTTTEGFVRLSIPNVVRPAPQHVWYEMRGRDQDCATLTYRYWRVVGFPDMTGTSYVGPKCGVNPLVDVVVLESDITS